MKKTYLIVLTDDDIEKLNRQKLLEQKIEEQGILIGWNAAGVKCQSKNLKSQIIVKYKNTKVMRFEKGNVLLCKIEGCYNPSITFDIYLCNSHFEGKKLKPKHCKSLTICIKYAYYGYIDNEPLFCKEHTSSDMVNVKAFKTKECKHPNCKTQPSFGFLGEKSQFCAEHKEEGMIDVVNKKCVHEKCGVRARYEYFGQIIPKYCIEHKKKDMMDITRVKCSYEGCKIIPSFGTESDSKKYCAEHREEGMKDVVNKKCSFSDCDTRPSYGYLFSKTYNHCSQHSTLNEYNETKRFPICTNSYCPNPAVFIDHEDELLQPIRCLNHKLITDVELVEKICISCHIKVYTPNNKDICAVCGNYRYKVILQKEHDLKLFLQYHSIEFIHNKQVHPSGSFKRPDFLINSVFGKIVLECDEFQHKKGYDKEEKRMITIYNDIQLLSKGSEVLFLRYNPDNYKGIQYDTNSRLEYLLFLLQHYISVETINTKLGVVYLFYNGFDNNPLLKEIVNHT